jgi:LysR family transcriptional regulator, cyn operon transcriptional activator
MLLRHIRYLKTVAELGSFTRAAQALHVSQPALSQQIKQMEDRIGAQLLDRTGRIVRPTDAGIAFLSHASRALSEVEAAGRAAQDVDDLSRGHLRLAMTPSFNAYLTAPVVKLFHQRYPGIRLKLTDMSQEEMEAALRDDALDLGLAFSDVRSEDIEWHALHSERLCLLAAASHPILRFGDITASRLRQEELVLLDESFVTRQTTDAHFRRYGIEPRIAVEASSISTIVGIVQTSRLVSILPDVVAREHKGLSARPLAPAIPPGASPFFKGRAVISPPRRARSRVWPRPSRAIWRERTDPRSTPSPPIRQA